MNSNGEPHPTGSGPSCQACIAAQTNPYAGQFINGCIGCSIRFTSQLPRSRRALILDKIVNPQVRERFHADCVAEYRRREALKAERPMQ